VPGRRRLRLGAIALLTAGACAAGAGQAAGAFTPQQIAAIDEAVAKEMARSGYPGMVAGIWAPGRGGAYVSTAGVADIATMAPVAADQPFRIGSITKTFTGTLIMQLVERGDLRLADRLSEFFPKVPQARRIRIRDLLDHTSGIPDLTEGIDGRVELFPETQWRPGRLIRLTSLQPSQCEVDTCFFYSNTNFVILGRIAEIVTGRPIERLYERRIFAPLGLEDTEFVPGTAVPDGIAHGYIEVSPDPAIDTTLWNFSWAFSAGAMVSTVDDLHRYARALATGRGLLSPGTQRRRLKFVPLGFTGRIYRYGLGIAKFGHYLGHNGEVPGYGSMLLHSPEDRATIVVLGNTSVTYDNFGSGTPPDPDLFGLAKKLRVVIHQGG
jgi:D-alanyl-D-alanine carboxypeptidase